MYYCCLVINWTTHIRCDCKLSSAQSSELCCALSEDNWTGSRVRGHCVSGIVWHGTDLTSHLPKRCTRTGKMPSSGVPPPSPCGPTSTVLLSALILLFSHALFITGQSSACICTCTTKLAGPTPLPNCQKAKPGHTEPDHTPECFRRLTELDYYHQKNPGSLHLEQTRLSNGVSE